MIVVDIQADGFKKNAISKAVGSERPSVRRPTRGIVLKEDTFATIKVITSSGEVVSLVDAGSRAKDKDNQPLQIGNKRATDVYSNFLVQAVNEDRQEKQQILETFGEPYIFLFGERARVITVQGILANTWDFNWESEWWYNYENYLRGTKCVENDAMVFLQFDDTLVGGYIINSAAQKMAQERNFVQFTFQMFVSFQTNLSNLGDANLPYNDSIAQNAGKYTSDGKISSTLSEDEAKVMRPPLLPPFQYAVQVKTDSMGTILQPDLFASVMQFAVNPLKKAWTFANDAVSKVTSAINNLTQTGVVEVPYGFAGTMAYDEVDLAEKIRQAKVGGEVTYSTFADNEDEYVNGTNQYASSDVNLLRYTAADPTQFDGTLGTLSYIDENIDGKFLNEIASIRWESEGHIVDPESFGPMGGTLTKGVAKGGWGLVKVQGIMGTREYRATEKSGLQFQSKGIGRMLNAVSAVTKSKTPGWF